MRINSSRLHERVDILKVHIFFSELHTITQVGSNPTGGINEIFLMSGYYVQTKFDKKLESNLRWNR